MQLIIEDTDNLSEKDVSILALLLGEKPAQAKPASQVMKEEAAAASKKATPKPKPEPAPEPMAEEELEEEEPEEEEEEEEEDETSDEDLLALAVKKATEMVGSGGAAKVREALDAAGASRVRELNADNVREFFKALS